MAWFSQRNTAAGAPQQANNLENFQREVRDARDLLAFAISQGRAVDDATMRQIEDAEQYLAPNQAWPADTNIRFQFEKAYRDLALLMSPVTIQTLRATTDGQGGAGRSIVTSWWSTADAKIWSRKLWGWIIICILAIFIGDNMGSYLRGLAPVDEESSSSFAIALQMLKSLLPFLYGWLGALAYLLRSANEYLAKRAFDMNRVPEYNNRMLLGFISGGIVLLFVDPSKASTTVKVSGNALAFIVGYNTDYLFQTIERVASAVFPKVTLTMNPPADGKPAPAGLKVMLNPASLTKPGTVKGAVQSPTALTSALQVALSIDPTDCTLSPGAVTIPAGALEAAFTVDVPATAQSGTKTVTAKAPGGMASAQFTVT